ncbi:MAG TPA: protein tyrosine phosphatase [Cytophagales bacterium]|nr:protein tyrosine phosphatase [Cytophagales bacterium]HAP61844.1 protein tyrosine phosphatase [Cytophagales bacterium]
MNVLFVCLGNICRSPMAEGVFTQLVRERGWEDRISIDSAGTSSYHIGELPDPRARHTMQRHGVTLTSRARQFTEADFDDFDYILAMDRNNYDNIVRLASSPDQKERVWMMRAFEDPAPTAHTSNDEVPDPYYGGDQGFEVVYTMLTRTHNHLLDQIAKETGWTE